MSASAHPRSLYKTSEFIGIVLCSIAFILQRQYPVATYNEKPNIQQLLGSLGLILFVYILRSTHNELASNGQPHKPGVPTTKLITSGTFHQSRNPIYTNIICILHPTLALLFGSTWFVLLIPLSCIMFWFILIRDEEKYLHQQFGSEWLEYCQHTRRWI